VHCDVDVYVFLASNFKGVFSLLQLNHLKQDIVTARVFGNGLYFFEPVLNYNAFDRAE
jgi:hypothetical protein